MRTAALAALFERQANLAAQQVAFAYALPAWRQGLITHARPLSPRPADFDLARWRDPATPRDPVSPENPTAWAQHPGPLALTIHSAFPPSSLPTVVAAQIAQRDLDAFLLEQVASAHRLNPALLATMNTL